MRFCVVTHVEHKICDGKFFAYGPYVQEMNLWFSLVEEVMVIAPLGDKEVSPIDLPYEHSNLKLISVPSLHVKNIRQIGKSLVSIFVIIKILFQNFQKVDHIHLRCPGNMGFLGAVVQMLFSKIPKTVKYAGNWDPNSNQPISYHWQKCILKNTFLSKNIKILVYGEWSDFTSNCTSFFTASYFESDKREIRHREWNKCVKFLFIGSLTSGKNPIYAIQLVERLHLNGIKVQLDIYGEGNQRGVISTYINQNTLHNFVKLFGNQNKEVVKDALQNAHFLVLPSKSEGWPKVVAEAMFWGCIPIATAVSCVPQMLENERGILLEVDLKDDVNKLLHVIQDPEKLTHMQQNGVRWSRAYTFEKFTSEIQKILSIS
ncbi:MAG: glycosyltransferase family 4 protein [Flavobacterium sp.]